MQKDDPLAKVLYVDLSSKKFRAALLIISAVSGRQRRCRETPERCPQDCDPLGPDSPIVFAVGPLTGLLPL